MSKKPKQSRHRVPTHALELAPAPIAARYQVEVDMSTQRLERRYRKAQKALEAAEKRAFKSAAVAGKLGKKALRRHSDLLLVVEERRRELRELERLMIPSAYNGRDSRLRHVRHETGAVTIPLGATTGQRPKPTATPTFPLVVRHAAERCEDL